MTPKSSDTLDVTLPSETQILITREFEAPRHLVFEAMTRPEHVRRWWSCSDMPVCEIDLRVGGRFRYVMLAPDGSEIGFHGEYLEVVAPERVVYTEVFELYPEASALVTWTFEERDGRTFYRSLTEHGSKAARDMHLQAMQQGAAEALDRLAHVARELAER